MKINIRIIILSSFVLTILFLLIFRACERPPKKGEFVYEKKCASCHGFEGEGFRNLIPPLNDSTYLMTNWENIACIVAYGMDQKITVNGVEYDQPMEGLPELNSIEIANVTNYLTERWGDPTKKITSEEVEKRMANCE